MLHVLLPMDRLRELRRPFSPAILQRLHVPSNLLLQQGSNPVLNLSLEFSALPHHREKCCQATQWHAQSDQERPREMFCSKTRYFFTTPQRVTKSPLVRRVTRHHTTPLFFIFFAIIDHPNMPILCDALFTSHALFTKQHNYASIEPPSIHQMDRPSSAYPTPPPSPAHMVTSPW